MRSRDNRDASVATVSSRPIIRVIANGRLAADAHVAEALYRRACGYSHDAVKIFMPSGASEPVYAHYTKHYPPDTKAALRWLMNRQPDKWRDRQQVDVSGTIAHRLSQMTPDERAAFALDLARQARQRLIDRWRDHRARAGAGP